MSSWRRHTLVELLVRERKPIVVSPGESYDQVGIRSFGRGFFHKPVASAAEIGNKKLFRIDEGDLVFNIVFAWEGAVALATADEHGRCGSHRFPTYRPVPELWLPRYAELFFQGPRGLALLQEASPGSAGRNRTLNQERLLSFSVSLPPIDEQQRVVTLIDAFDGAIAASEAYIRRLHAVQLGLRDQLIEAPGYPEVDFGSMLRAIEAGKSPQAEDRLPGPGESAVLKVSAVRPGFYDPTGVKTLPATVHMPEHARVQVGDLLMTRANTSALVGAVCVVDETPENYFLCDKTLRLVVSDDLNKQYVVHAAATRRLRRDIGLVATGSSATMKNISQAKIRALRVRVPNLSAQKTIAARLDVGYAALRAAQDHLVALRAARQGAVRGLLGRENVTARRAELDLVA